MREYRLSELYDNVSTNSLSRALLYENGDVLNLHYGDIHLKYSGLIDTSKAELPYALKTDYKFVESRRMETGDMIFADAAEDYEGIGIAVEIGQTGATPSYAGLHTIHLKRKTDILASGYMGYLSQAYAFRRKVWFIAQGAKVLGISSKELLKQSVAIPNIAEQNTIVSRLKAADQKINLLTKKKEALVTYKKGLMQKIFSQEVRFKRKDGTDYPEWEAKHLGELCSITTGKLDANAQVEDGRYLFFTCAKEVFRIDEYAFEGASLLVSGNGANVGYIHNYEGRFNAYQRTYVLQNIGVNRYYLQYYLEQNLHRRIHREKKDGNTPYIVMSTLTMMKIALPSENEANKIAKAMMTIDESLEQLTNKLNSTVALKKGLLQQMFV